jgi:hypothetical protein
LSGVQVAVCNDVILRHCNLHDALEALVEGVLDYTLKRQ